MEQSEIVEKNKKLYVLDPWESSWTKPIQYRLAWPTGLDARDYQFLVGKHVSYVAGGLYRLPNGTFLRLESGEKTKPDFNQSEERRIPRPRHCHEYRNGRWVR